MTDAQLAIEQQKHLIKVQYGLAYMQAGLNACGPVGATIGSLLEGRRPIRPNCINCGAPGETSVCSYCGTSA